jgi:hypothetical protein
MIKQPRDWMPAERHKRSQKTLVFTLDVDATGPGVALMKISFRSEGEIERPDYEFSMSLCDLTWPIDGLKSYVQDQGKSMNCTL